MGLSKEAAIKQVEASEAEEFIVRTTDEEANYLKNYTDTEVEKEIGSRISKVHTQYDDDYFKVTGRRKADGEKTYAFIEKDVTNLVAEAKKVELLNQQIEELKKGKGDNAEVKRLQDELKSLEDKQAELVKGWADKETEMNGKFHTQRVQASLDNAIKGMKFKKTIPEQAVNAYLDSIKSELTSQAEFVDDKLVFNKDGELLRHDTTLKPKTASDILTERLGDFLDNGKKAGTGTFIEGDGEKPDSVNLTVPGDVTTKTQLSEFLKTEIIRVFASKGYTKGMVHNTPEYIAAYGEYGKDLPLN